MESVLKFFTSISEKVKPSVEDGKRLYLFELSFRNRCIFIHFLILFSQSEAMKSQVDKCSSYTISVWMHY
jgi:hypothetical protein